MSKHNLAPSPRLQLLPYPRLRREGCGRFTALILALSHFLAWTLFRMESPSWQRLREYHQQWYPHLANKQPSLGDPLRYLIQTIWLLIVQTRTAGTKNNSPQWTPAFLWVKRILMALLKPIGFIWQTLTGPLFSLPNTLQHWHNQHPFPFVFNQWPQWMRRLCYSLVLVMALSLGSLAITITVPFDYLTQLAFTLLIWLLAILISKIPHHFATLLLICLSIIVSCRYLWWRYTSTLNWNDSLDLSFGLILLAAETYSWLVLIFGYIQTSWPLQRQPAPLPKDQSQWPSVDLLVPTYNEELSIVRTTIYAAKGLDWPSDKLNIYILDDGHRESFRQFAKEAGVGYLDRPDNRHAKAGNLNYALRSLKSELIAIFDCDHVPVRAFLQFTTGWFLRDSRLALVQTPHHFFSPDPFEHNLGTFRKDPNEGKLFYGLIQDGNDMWNSAFFCGSCALLRRTAIDSIGGFAVETVTEDAHTALRLHRQGWNSAYIRLPLAAGLATDNLASHIGQRIRWARGMAQIFRLDNPWVGRGLSFFQRICYSNAMLHFLAGLPRLVFLTAPLAFLILHAYIIYAPAAMILLYVFPHMMHANLANARIQGRFRKSFWGEIYETSLAWYIAWPTTVALINPKKGRFNVTSKGYLASEDHFDWGIASPYLVLVFLNVAGLGFGIWRMLYGPANEVGTIVISLIWVIYNLLVIGAAIAVAAEAHQLRHQHRIAIRQPACIRLPSGHLMPAQLVDYTDSSVGVICPLPEPLPSDCPLMLILHRGTEEFAFPGKLRRQEKDHLGIEFNTLDQQQKIDFIHCTFARADNWLQDTENPFQDQPLDSFTDMLATGCQGAYQLYRYFPYPKYLLRPIKNGLRWLYSYFPRRPQLSNTQSRRQ